MTLPSLPSMPRKNSSNKPVHECACGCGMGTKSVWFPGHDGRATGWAIRIERGICTLDDTGIERKGAMIMLKRRDDERKAKAKKIA